MCQLLTALKPVLLAVRCCFVQPSVRGLRVCMLEQAALPRPSFPTTSPLLGHNNHLTQRMCKVVSKRFYLQSICALSCAVCALHGDCLMSKAVAPCCVPLPSEAPAEPFRPWCSGPQPRSLEGASQVIPHPSWLGHISRSPVANADIQQMGR